MAAYRTRADKNNLHCKKISGRKHAWQESRGGAPRRSRTVSALQGGRLLHGKLGSPDDAAQGCGDRRGAGCHRGGETTGIGNRRKTWFAGIPCDLVGDVVAIIVSGYVLLLRTRSQSHVLR